MNRLIVIMALSTAAGCAQSVGTQISPGRVSIENMVVRRLSGPGRASDSVSVTYTAVIGPQAVARDHSLLVAPVIVGGDLRQSLPAMLIHGRGSEVSRRRRELAFGTGAGYADAHVAECDSRVDMRAVVPFAEWMHGSSVVLESVEGGCCAWSQSGEVVVAENILPHPPLSESPPEPAWVPVSVADSLSTAFDFVVPFSSFDPAVPFVVYNDEAAGGLEIYFPVASHVIDPGYLDNAHTLGNLTGCIEMISSSPDSRVARVVVAGFASPEGSFEFNDRLAFDRAVSLKRYMMDTTGLSDETIAIFNGSVDWRALRARVARSQMPERKELAALIDDAMPSHERFARLARMNGGATYRHLLKEHFPYLRSGAFIKVFYENK